MLTLAILVQNGIHERDMGKQFIRDAASCISSLSNAFYFQYATLLSFYHPCLVEESYYIRQQSFLFSDIFKLLSVVERALP